MLVYSVEMTETRSFEKKENILFHGFMLNIFYHKKKKYLG